MHQENMDLNKKSKPLRSGINRSLIAKNYKVGRMFVIKDYSNVYDMNKGPNEKE